MRFNVSIYIFVHVYIYICIIHLSEQHRGSHSKLGHQQTKLTARCTVKIGGSSRKFQISDFSNMDMVKLAANAFHEGAFDFPI